MNELRTATINSTLDETSEHNECKVKERGRTHCPVDVVSMLDFIEGTIKAHTSVAFNRPASVCPTRKDSSSVAKASSFELFHPWLDVKNE